MANKCKPLINVVIKDKPKMLTGLMCLGCVASYSTHADRISTGGQVEPNPFVSVMWNVVSPYSRPLGR